MKSFLLLALAGSAAAFAPSQSKVRNIQIYITYDHPFSLDIVV